MKNCRNCELLLYALGPHVFFFYVMPKALIICAKAHRTDPFAWTAQCRITGSVPSNKQSIYSYNSSAKNMFIIIVVLQPALALCGDMQLCAFQDEWAHAAIRNQRAFHKCSNRAPAQQYNLFDFASRYANVYGLSHNHSEY